MRIGLRQIKNIATALAMEQLFVSKNDIVKGYMSRIWVDTIDIVASSMAVLQIHTNQTKTARLTLTQ
jgi:HD-like signal output (HDOD) protein